MSARESRGGRAGPRRGAGSLGAAALGLALGTVVTAVVVAGRALLDPGPEIVQPIEFNHRLHVEDEGLDCATCHSHESYELPKARLCALCHSEPQGDSLEEARLVALLESGDPLEWAPLYRQPHHVYYSHRRHVDVAGLDCATCHGDIASSEAPPRRVTPLSMDACMDCHERQKASLDCSACHR